MCVYTIIGGDLRYEYLAHMLAREGHTVEVMGLDSELTRDAASVTLEHIAQNRCTRSVLLPFNIKYGDVIFSPDGKSVLTTLDALLGVLGSGDTVFSGKLKDEHELLAAQKGICLYNMLADEEFAINNAIATAEGAVMVAVENTVFTLHGASVLIIGYGRIGKLLARLLQGFGAEVYVTDRKTEELVWVSALGCKPVIFAKMADCLGQMNIVFNTAPAMVLNKDNLEHISKDCLIIDLASLPGGLDKAEAQRLGLKTIHTLGLPGRVAPWSAAMYLKQIIINKSCKHREEIPLWLTSRQASP